VMVSSASVERVFPLLNHSFDDHQQVPYKTIKRIGGQNMINNFYYFSNVKIIHNVYKV
jgi:hypothetical protein